MPITTKPFVTDENELRALMIRTSYRKLRWLFAVVGLLILGFLYEGYVRSDLTWVVIGIAYAVLIAALPVLLAWRGTMSLRKSRIGKKPMSLEFLPKECLVIDETEEIRARYKYDEMWKSEIVKEGIALWVTTRLYILFPRRAFNSDTDFREAGAMLAAGIPAAK